MRAFSVEVHVDGNSVLYIEPGCISGIGNLADFREEIIAAADNLIAFIGREESEFVIHEEKEPE